MASLETLRKAILLSLEKNRSLLVGLADYRLPELAGALAGDAARAIDRGDEGPILSRARLRDVVLGALRSKGARPWEMSGAVSDAVLELIARERRSVFAWPPALEIDCEVLCRNGRWERIALRRDGRWELYDGLGIAGLTGGWDGGWDWPLVWRHSPEMATEGGFGARHKGRPRQTEADADGRCPTCDQETKAPRERLFFPRAFHTPGGVRWLAENGVRLWP